MHIFSLPKVSRVSKIARRLFHASSGKMHLDSLALNVLGIHSDSTGLSIKKKSKNSDLVRRVSC